MPSGKALGQIEDVDTGALADADDTTLGEKINEILDAMRKRGWVDD